VDRANNFERRIINSRLFKFIVDETIDGTPTEFSVHKEAIARLSKPLHRLVKGGWSEAQGIIIKYTKLAEFLDKAERLQRIR
jgi:hypothetical protein